MTDWEEWLTEQLWDMAWEEAVAYDRERNMPLLWQGDQA